MTNLRCRPAARLAGGLAVLVGLALLAGCAQAQAQAEPATTPQVASLPPPQETAPAPKPKPALEADALHCLALTVYFEGRSEGREFGRAIAHVVLNRVADPRFPDTVCGVVKDGGTKRNACQFSWWCDGKPDQPYNQTAWEAAQNIARQATRPDDPDPTGGALYFHDGTVQPAWTHRLKQTATIGADRFYQ